MWQCPDCGEKLGSQFDACWQCGFQQEVAESPAPSAGPPSVPAVAPRSDLNHRNARIILLAALLILAVVEYLLLAGRVETATVSELALVAAVGCLGIYLLFCHSWFRRFQYRLRTLLLTVLLVSLGTSWFAVRMHEARQQKEAVDAITRAGGSAMYSFEKSSVPAPVWRQTLFQNDFFSEGLPQLEWLYLTGTQVTDAGLKHLEGLTRLQALALSGKQITDTGLAHLAGLTQLRLLDLKGTQVTDAGLEHLRNMSQLQLLDLRETHVTKKGAERLQEVLPACKIQYEAE